MKNIILTLLILIICFLPIKAQNSAVITGQIINQDKESIPYATVSLHVEDEQLIAGNITDNEGRFELAGIETGSYIIEISYIGYSKFKKEVLIGQLNDIYDLGKLVLEETNKELNEVNVIAQKAVLSNALEKKSFDMDDNISQAGGSVMDAMKSMPGISFNQEGKVIIRGSDKVIVLINGKQSSIAGFGNQKGLDNIPASNIEKIEIINNPSAKYDANGMAGVINIVYKKESKNGFNGKAGFTYGIGAITKARPDLPSELGSYSKNSKYIPSLDLNWGNAKSRFYLQSEVLHQKSLPNNEFTTRYYDDGRTIASQVAENRTQTRYIFKGGADFDFNERNRLTVQGLFDWESHIDTAQVPYLDVNANEYLRFIAWNEEEITGHINLNVNYEHKFKQTGHKIDFTFLYAKEWEDETYYINEKSADRVGRDVTSILGTEYIRTGMVDYVKPMFSGRLEAGAKIQIRDLPVDYTQMPDENTILYPGLGNWSDWGEDTYAGYVNWVHEKQHYGIEAGIRSEFSHVSYFMDPANIYYKNNDEYDYFKIFPNLRFTYKLNDNHRFSIFYNMRIDRPGEPELRMYPKSDDHELVKVGNPYLRPQYTNVAEMAYKTNWSTGSVFLAGYYKFIKDSFVRVYTEDNSNPEQSIVIKTYANTGISTNTGAELIVSQQLLKIWKLSANANVYYNEFEGYTGTLLFPYEHTFTIKETTDWTSYFKLNNTFKLPKSTEVQITAQYFAPKNIPQGRELSRSSIDLGIKKSYKDGKLELSLSASDVFNDFALKQEIRGDGFDATYENYYETQIIRAGIKYKL